MLKTLDRTEPRRLPAVNDDMREVLEAAGPLHSGSDARQASGCGQGGTALLPPNSNPLPHPYLQPIIIFPFPSGSCCFLTSHIRLRPPLITLTSCSLSTSFIAAHTPPPPPSPPNSHPADSCPFGYTLALQQDSCLSVAHVGVVYVS